MYYFYLKNMVLPITPAAVNIAYGGQNKTYTLINDGEINFLKEAKLQNIAFEFLLPAQQYPFANYPSGFVAQTVYLEWLKKLKKDKKPFQFIIVRMKPNYTPMFYTNVKVSLEDYTLKEDAKNAFDVVVSIKLKEYKDFGTKTVVVNSANDSVTLENVRDTSNSPMPTSAKQYTVKSGDTLWALAKKNYGDGSKYTVIAKANKIANPNLIYVNQKITIPKL